MFALILLSFALAYIFRYWLAVVASLAVEYPQSGMGASDSPCRMTDDPSDFLSLTRIGCGSHPLGSIHECTRV